MINPSQTTFPSLLTRLVQPTNEEAWTRLVQLITPLLYYWTHRAGLTQEEADDLVKEVFTQLVEALPNFPLDPSKSFPGWLRTITLNRWQALKRRKSERTTDGANAAVAFWEDEYRQHLARRALMLMQTDFPRDVWQVCWATVVEGKSDRDIAAVMKCDLAKVYRAKFRVLSRLRAELAGMME